MGADMDTVRVIEIRRTRKAGPLRAFVDSESHLCGGEASSSQETRPGGPG
jgi:hypothetical protein